MEARRSYEAMTRSRAPGGKVLDWINVDDDEVNRRVGHVAVEYDGTVLVWGGFLVGSGSGANSANHHVYWKPDWLMRYRPSSRTWRPLKTNPRDCPPPTSSAAACVVGSHLYVLCGFAVDRWDDEDEDNGGDDDEEATLKSEGIDRVLTTTGPGGAAGGSHAFNERDTNQVYALDLRTRCWKRLCPSGVPPLKCDKLSCWEHRGKIYLFGGYGPMPESQHRLDVPVDVVWIPDHSVDEDVVRGWTDQLVAFDPAACSWEWPLASGQAPGPRAAHACDVHAEGGYAIVSGGRFGSHRLNDMYHLDMASLRWTLLQPQTDEEEARMFGVPIGRSWHSFTRLAGSHRFLLFGGYSSGEKPLGDAWVLDVDAGDLERCSWRRMDGLDDGRVRIWHRAARIPGGGEGAMIVGGFGSALPIHRTCHGGEVVFVETSPRSLYSRALDAVCEAMLARTGGGAVPKGELPERLRDDVDQRMPKYLYERGKALAAAAARR